MEAQGALEDVTRARAVEGELLDAERSRHAEETLMLQQRLRRITASTVAAMENAQQEIVTLRAQLATRQQQEQQQQEEQQDEQGSSGRIGSESGSPEPSPSSSPRQSRDLVAWGAMGSNTASVEAKRKFSARLLREQRGKAPHHTEEAGGRFRGEREGGGGGCRLRLPEVPDEVGGGSGIDSAEEEGSSEGELSSMGDDTEEEEEDKGRADAEL